MNRLVLLLTCCLVISACSKKQKQADNEKLILGDWVRVNTGGGPNSEPPFFVIPGYTFYPNHTCDNKAGYFKYIPNNDPDNGSLEDPIYLGSLSKFKIMVDSLKIFNPERNKWNNYKVNLLTRDSMKLENNANVSVYKHFLNTHHKSQQFDKIIVSTSNCFGPCPVSSTIINSDGAVIFKGVSFTSQKGLFEGKISKAQYQRLEDNFNKSNIDLLNTRYEAGITDSQTITVTFVKDGKIYKTILDYGRKAPYLFQWASVPFTNFYQTIQLKKAFLPEYLSGPFVTEARFGKGDSVLDLKQSETFLLFNYWRSGKIYSADFKPRFKLHTYFEVSSFADIITDGRFFTFSSKGHKPVTIDIGFNFYDINAKNWHWRKAGEGD